MAPRRKAAGKGQVSSALGKRSREPLAEQSTNAGLKRAKAAPDSHSGENENEKSSKAKRRSNARIIDDTTDDESLYGDLGEVGGDISDGKFWDDDTEDLIEEASVDDAVRDREQAAELQEWFRYQSKHDRLAGLGSQERDVRMERCRAPFSFILDAFKQTAEGISKKDYDDLEKRKHLPFLFPWWIFFLRISLEATVEFLLASLSDAVKVILGGSMDSEELLLLPDRWEGCKLWGVYTDIFKKDTVDEAVRYCGSGTAIHGVGHRMKVYPAVHRGGQKAEIGAHGDFLKRKDEQPNLRLIAVFVQSAPKPYVFLMELLLSILLQTLNLNVTKYVKRMRTLTIEMIQRATPRDLPKAEYDHLSSAAQCLQGLCYRKPKIVV